MKKRKILPIVLVVLIISLVGSTFAWLGAKDNVVNYFKTEPAKIVILPEEEDFDEDDDNKVQWDGKIKTKKVKVTNTSDSEVNVLIRVNLTPRWVEKESDTPFAGDVSIIDLVYSKFLSEEDDEDAYKTGGKWIYGEDGYYYYKKDVKPGDSTEILLESVKVKEGYIIPDSYLGKDLIVDVNAEAVVADENSFEKVWNITNEKNSKLYNLLSSIVGKKIAEN